ncbi:MAG: calcium/sodium antiporter [Rhodospirillales bacterium]
MEITLNLLAIAGGLALLVWSAERFVTASADLASRYSVPPLLIGMVIIGFGTSTPEMMVSAFAALEGNPGLALGNAYGSNIANIALILGVTAVICPIAVHSAVVRKEVPILLAVTGLSLFLVLDGQLTRSDAIVLLGVFAALLAWSVYEGSRNRIDPMGHEMQEELGDRTTSSSKAILTIGVGLLVLIASSRLLVWGAVELAGQFGVPDLVIGLTIVAVGTSLPEFAASVTAARRGHADMALGNVLGSNLFNTLAVVGLAGVISPIDVPIEVINRDLPIVALITFALLIACLGFKQRAGRINRTEGACLVTAFIAYTAWLVI